MAENVIEVKNLTKNFGSERAIDGLNFQIDEGEVFGFVGPNGAGKSTTINIMLGFQRPTKGSVKIFDKNIQKSPLDVKSRIGVVPEDYNLYDGRTGKEHLGLSSRLKKEDIDKSEMADRVGLTEDEINRKVSGYSTGMKQRLVLGMALIGDPDLLILDEPGSGLDPNGILKLQEIIREQSDMGTSVFFSSHILSNIEAACDKIGVLDRGRIEFTGNIDELRKETEQTKEMIVRYEGDQPSDINLEDKTEILEASIHGNKEIHIKYEQQMYVEEILNELTDSEADIKSVETNQQSLSELFGEITSRTEGDKE